MDNLNELVTFLDTPNEQVQLIALQNLLPYSMGQTAKPYLFEQDDHKGIKSLRKILLETTNPELRKLALTGLINLSGTDQIRELLASNSSDLSHFVTKISSTSEPHAGLYCMLLANLAHDKGILSLVGPNLDLLIFTLLKSPPMTSFDYLGFTFGEIAKFPKGVQYLVSKLPKLYSQLHSPSLTRRSGVAAAIKNTLFDLSTHKDLAETALVENIMIALKGPETLDDEDTAKLPEAVRTLMGENKRREPDVGQQIVLVECLLLLSSSSEGRVKLREDNAYFVVRELHLATDDGDLKQSCERWVNQVMRGEPEEPRIQEVVEEDDEEDEEIVEVV